MQRSLLTNSKTDNAQCRTQNIQSGPEKIAQSLMYRHSATVCNRITRFSPKCPGKIAVYQSMQKLYQLVKYFW